MILLILAAVVICSLAGLIVLHLGVEALQGLIALAAMTIIWHVLNRRPNTTIADDFRNW